MQDKKKCKDYVNALSQKHGLTKKQTNDLLIYFTTSLAEEIKNGNDIRIPMFAHIYFDKDELSQRIIRNAKKENNG